MHALLLLRRNYRTHFIFRLQARAVTPSSDKFSGSQASLYRSNTRLDDILSNDRKKPAIVINGSTQSIKKLIEETDPHKEMRNGSAINISRGTNANYKL